MNSVLFKILCTKNVKPGLFRAKLLQFSAEYFILSVCIRTRGLIVSLLMLLVGVKIVKSRITNTTYRTLKAFKNRVLRKIHGPRRGISGV
jgi:hypothetical protein